MKKLLLTISYWKKEIVALKRVYCATEREIKNMGKTNNTATAWKWTGIGLLYGSILFSFIFYIIIMVTGFTIPEVKLIDNYYFLPKNIGLWTLTWPKTGECHSTISNTAIVCITFIIISLGLLISGFVVYSKSKLTINKFLIISTITSFSIFALTLILTMIAKVDVSNTEINIGQSKNFSIWFKLHLYGNNAISMEYTIQAIVIVILLSISITLPTTYTIIALTKIPYRN